MADWIENVAAQHRTRRSSDPPEASRVDPGTPHAAGTYCKATRPELEAAEAIEPIYRKGNSPVIVEMDQAEKDVVDQGRLDAYDDEQMTIRRERVSAISATTREHLNKLGTGRGAQAGNQGIDAAFEKINETLAHLRDPGGTPIPSNIPAGKFIGTLEAADWNADIRANMEKVPPGEEIAPDDVVKIGKKKGGG